MRSSACSGSLLHPPHVRVVGSAAAAGVDGRWRGGRVRATRTGCGISGSRGRWWAMTRRSRTQRSSLPWSVIRNRRPLRPAGAHGERDLSVQRLYPLWRALRPVPRLREPGRDPGIR